ncbi:NAD(P)H-dependent oxidoreductase [Curvivirga sp.]|uniref:NAD(P)H-dependent oxidoreductase n=1 Tax=Curvivirga sp. TaxID=2856848 RepID=UPI003B5AE92C
MAKTVVISGHPDLEQSNTNKVILDELRKELDDLVIRRLDILYPDYKIDVEAEQKALLEADIIILQFPFYWYSIPALLKKWIDDVFSYNFAYGAQGDKLKGKQFILSFTVGGPEESYDPLGYNHFSIEQFMYPLQQTAYLAGMQYNKPIFTHRMVYIPGVYNKLEDVQFRAKKHAEQLISRVHELNNSMEITIKQFVADWFEMFDQLPTEDHKFISHLSNDVNWEMPEGQFKGHQGFRDWYEGAKKTFKPDCLHDVEQVEVQENGDGYKALIRVRLKADTYEDSPFKGEAVNILVNENWSLKSDEKGHILIDNYQVTPVTA